MVIGHKAPQNDGRRFFKKFYVFREKSVNRKVAKGKSFYILGLKIQKNRLKIFKSFDLFLKISEVTLV